MTKRRITTVLAALLALTSAGSGAWASEPESEAAGGAAPEFDRTPPRLAYAHGEVSFWRPGAQDWASAQVNAPLAPGDLLYAAPGGTVELQVGARAFVRAGGGPVGAQIGLDSLEPDYLQFKVTSGTASLDIRELRPGYTVDVNTPDAVLTIERPGYYRIDISTDRTAFLARRGGQATLTSEDGARVPVKQNEQVVISGGAETRVEVAAAPELTDWDRWNYARTDSLLNAASARYVPSGVYGASDLDRHGSWRVVEEYGPVWVPAAVPAGWAPYSSGRWIWDPYFGWTWVDDAPWGWAPYHYGRWVYVSGYWAWAPGPIVVRPHYAPALVAFLGPVSVTVGRPIAWVALGWGEPCVPWWGPPRFVGRPWWGGWGGPRVVNKVVVHKTTVVNVTNINVYRNAEVRHAVITVPAERFGRGSVAATRLANGDVKQLRPVHGALAVKPTPASLVPAAGPAVKPDTLPRRSVVAIRPPHDVSPRLQAEGLAATPAPAVAVPRTKLLAVPDRGTPTGFAPERRSPGTPGADTPDRGRTPRGGREVDREREPGHDRARQPGIELPSAGRGGPAEIRKPSGVGPESRENTTKPTVPAAPPPSGSPAQPPQTRGPQREDRGDRPERGKLDRPDRSERGERSQARERVEPDGRGGEDRSERPQRHEQRESRSAARPDRSERRALPAPPPVVPQNVAPQTLAPAPRRMEPSAPPQQPAPAPQVPQPRETQRPALVQHEPPQMPRPAPAQQPPQVQRPPAPLPVQQQPPQVHRSAPAPVQPSPQVQRPPASPAPERAARPGPVRVERRREPERIAPRASGSPEGGPQAPPDEPSRERRGEPAGREIARGSR